MSVSNTVTKVEEFDFEDEALEVLETDAELTSDEELVAVEGQVKTFVKSLMLLRKVLMRPRCISAKLVFTAPYCRRRSALCSSCLTW